MKKSKRRRRPAPIPFANERLILATAILEIFNVTTRYLCCPQAMAEPLKRIKPDGNFARPDLVHLIAAVWHCHLLGHPVTASGLAALVGVPRTTVNDRLRELIADRRVRREGDRYVIAPNRMSARRTEGPLYRVHEIILQAAQDLTPQRRRMTKSVTKALSRRSKK